jgi:hypothetical protein
MRTHQISECQAPRATEAVMSNENPTLIANPTTQLLSHDHRAEFYIGHERVTLQTKQLQRVRELQEANDDLQRQMLRNEKELTNSEDPLSILADIEHSKVIVSRNTGEILNIYTQNELRLIRIAQLQAQNLNLQQEMSDAQGNFITCQEMTKRAKFAAEFFLSKNTFEKNVVEIRELNQH